MSTMSGAPRPSQRERVPITPATRVADLLESWPELEEVLIAQAPAFRRLKNPVLRRTVARVATLTQAAGVGGIPVRELVATLRRAAGLDDVDAGDPGTASSGDAVGPAAPPDWLAHGQVAVTLDADALLEAGEVPLPKVIEAARTLGAGKLLRVESSFRPVPLLDALAKLACPTFVRETAPGRFETFVAGPPA